MVGLPPVLLPLQYFFLARMESHLAGDVDYDTLVRQGKEAPGEVTSVRVGEGVPLNGERPWIVEYRFVVDGHERRAEMKTVDKHIVGDWQEGHPVRVKYFGPESMITDIEPYGFPLWNTVSYIWLFSACGNIVIGLPVLLYAVAPMRKKVRLYQSGALTTGKIVALEPFTWLGFLLVAKFRFRVGYRFQDRDGKDVAGSSTSTNLALLNGGKQGDPVDVLFIESCAEINCLAEEQDLLALPDNA